MACNFMRKLFFAAVFFGVSANVFGAVGCSLNDPDRDIKRLFPEATNYKTEFMTIEEKGGQKLADEIQVKRGDKFEPVYETIDVPYAFYTVLKGDKLLGYVHGVNQKGRFGGMQLIITSDPNGVIKDFYYQRLTSPEAKKFRDPAFTKQFAGLNLADFYRHKPQEQIKDPTENSNPDFKATLRGLFKNLILMDTFKLNNKYDTVYNEVQKNENKNPNSN
ncbi:MAG: hypothetical protein A2173_00440 [Planctomycetes bacterium RBG_13_44_8b]|nr:MAG: hypothetical protein A2173_00440 [Planctomycetes bacterium RBG_13_44_8b]